MILSLHIYKWIHFNVCIQGNDGDFFVYMICVDKSTCKIPSYKLTGLAPYRTNAAMMVSWARWNQLTIDIEKKNIQRPKYFTETNTPIERPYIPFPSLHQVENRRSKKKIIFGYGRFLVHCADEASYYTVLFLPGFRQNLCILPNAAGLTFFFFSWLLPVTMIISSEKNRYISLFIQLSTDCVFFFVVISYHLA